MFLIMALYALFAASFTIAKILLSFLPPMFLIAVRMMLAGGILLGAHILWDYKKIYSKITPYFLIWWFVFSAVQISIPYIAEFVALDTIAPSCSALIYNLTPFFSAIFSYLYFGEIMTGKKWLGFIIGLGGIIWFVCDQSIFSFDFNLAYLLMLLAVVSCALGWIYVRALVRQGYSPLMINGVTMMVGGIQALLMSYMFHESMQLPWGRMLEFVGWLMAIIILTNVIYYNFYAQLLKRYTATLLAFCGCVVPLFVAVYDWLLLGIAVDARFFIALIVASYGVYLFYQEELRQGYISS